ncbi:MAG TPA: 4-(cytidine 5'-diphospho)-2-C-methyl-D-erythritol kinase [Lacunisphaera sp.]|nr:4-(cytidine 5'-diphospho)-2-C-methyl-D-erythritol kinase [Lacunisphaera sp.]
MERSIFSPAKLNLFLAITGRRADGFHDLVSVAAPLDLGDELAARGGERRGGSQFSLECDDPSIPAGADNLVLRAADAFATATGWREAVHFQLTKRIPAGAGLGGGSSNAVAALRLLNELAGRPLGPEALAGLAAGLGSDCALFLANAPVVMRGRGEHVTPLPPAAAARLRGRRVLLLKPAFSISTAWAYGRMAATGTGYRPPAEAEAHLAAWLGGAGPAEELLANDMEEVAFDKFVALPVLLAALRRDFGLAPRMSGSGSACYALLRDDCVTAPISAFIRAGWGPAAFVREARLA